MSNLRRLCFALLILLLVLSAAFIPGCSLTPDRYVYLKYSFSIDPLAGEKIKDLILFLPCPNQKGRIIKKVLEDIKSSREKYHSKQDYAKISVQDTKYGQMLKIKLENLDRGMGSGAQISIPEKMAIGEYYLWQESGNHRSPYLYSPRFGIKKKDKGRHAHSMIYSKGQGGSGFKLGIRYDISDRAPSLFPYIIGDEWGGDFIAFFGTEEPPDPIIGSAGVTFKIKEFGWKTIPVAECE